MKISLLISTFNRGEQLRRSLSRLAHLTLPDELIVVDDGSTGDRTSEVVHGLAPVLGLPLKYIYRDKKGLGYDISSVPRNIGLKQASYEWLLVAEPEALFITDVVAQFRACVQERPNLVVSAGRVYFTNPLTPIDDSVVTDPLGYLGRQDVKLMPMHPEDQFNPDGTRINFTQATVTWRDNMTATFCVMYKRDWLMEIGGWDEDYSVARGGGGWGFEDTCVLTRLRIRGYNQWINPDIQVIHQWHDRPPNPQADGWKRNEEIFLGKSLAVDGVEDPNNPELIANRGREWGVL
jgi:GT2 family glycosyltransferase